MYRPKCEGPFSSSTSGACPVDAQRANKNVFAEESSSDITGQKSGSQRQAETFFSVNVYEIVSSASWKKGNLQLSPSRTSIVPRPQPDSFSNVVIALHLMKCERNKLPSKMRLTILPRLFHRLYQPWRSLYHRIWLNFKLFISKFSLRCVFFLVLLSWAFFDSRAHQQYFEYRLVASYLQLTGRP